MRWLAPLLLLAAGLAAQTDSKSWIDTGVAAFKNARYQEAVAAFQKAAELDPANVTAHLYLGTAYMQQYIPGAESAENRALSQNAVDEFQRVLALDANNKVALQSLASLSLYAKKWDDARRWYGQILTVDSNNREAYYSLAFIDWSQWYPAYGATRSRLGMRPEQPGPIPDASVRASLRAQWWSTIEDGIWNLTRALELDPKYDDAMAYMNLFIRERADLRDTKAEYEQDIRTADDWVGKALQTKKEKAEQGMTRQASGGPPPPPPPPPPGSQSQAISISGASARPIILSQVQPVYPPLAMQARVQGIVRFVATIDKEGHVANLQVQSGHPLLIQPAIDAARQWVFRPTLLNGQPVDVKTQLDINFVLPQ